MRNESGRVSVLATALGRLKRRLTPRSSAKENGGSEPASKGDLMEGASAAWQLSEIVQDSGREDGGEAPDSQEQTKLVGGRPASPLRVSAFA